MDFSLNTGIIMIKLKSNNVLTIEATSGTSADALSTSAITASLLKDNIPVSGEPIDLSATSLTTAFPTSVLNHSTVVTDNSGVSTAAQTGTLEENVKINGTLLGDTSVTAQTTVTFGNIWNNFYRLDTLKVDFRNNSSARNATIFGNGNNQVAVLAHVKILGPDASTVLSIPEDELKQQISLINYGTGEKLNYNGNSPDCNKPWIYSDEDKGFADAFQYNSPLPVNEKMANSDVSIITFYVSADDLASGLDIGLSINVPGVGEFNTTSNGTSTKNGPKGESGSVIKLPSFVHLSALSRIDYTDVTNLHISGMPSSYNDFNVIYDNQDVFYFEIDPVRDDPYIDTFTYGESARSKFTIRPQNSNFLFKKIDVQRKYAKVDELVIIGEKSAADLISFNNVFETINNDEYDVGHLQLIFVNQKSGGIEDGVVRTQGARTTTYYSYYGYNVEGGDFYVMDIPAGIITVCISDFIIIKVTTSGYAPGTKLVAPYNWSVPFDSVAINVSDYYGNNGVITLNSSESQWPKILINQ